MPGFHLIAAKWQFLVWRILVLVAGLATPGIAFAYLDPGVVSLFLQCLVGAIAAIGAAASLWWNNIRNFLERRKNRGNAAPVTREKSEDDRASTR
jgi:hypothetical protein